MPGNEHRPEDPAQKSDQAAGQPEPWFEPDQEPREPDHASSGSDQAGAPPGLPLLREVTAPTGDSGAVAAQEHPARSSRDQPREPRWAPPVPSGTTATRAHATSTPPPLTAASHSARQASESLAAPVPAGQQQLHWATVPLRTLLVTVVLFTVVGVLLLELDIYVTAVATMALTLLVIGTTGAVHLGQWWMHTYELHQDHLLLRRGLVWRTVREVPLSRLQTVDVVSPLLIRVLGLAELRIELAGGDGSEVRLGYISRDEAGRLSAVLLAHAGGLPGHVAPPPERPVFGCPTRLLLTALVAQVPVLLAFGGLLLLSVVGLAFREPGVLGGVVPLALGLVRGLVGPLFRYAGFRAALAPDGLRLRSGLLQRRTQIVPPGRVHAVRVVEPLLWQLLGVARLEANVAGYVGERQMASATLLPVAPRQLAFELARELLAGSDSAQAQVAPVNSQRRRGTELRVTDGELVASQGMLRHTCAIVPHGSVQSLRLRSGLFGRLLGRSTLLVETVPGPVRLRVPGRESSEGWRILTQVTQRVRWRRHGRAGSERWATHADTWADSAG